MSNVLPTPESPQVPAALVIAADHLRADLMKMRAQRQVGNTLQKSTIAQWIPPSDAKELVDFENTIPMCTADMAYEMDLDFTSGPSALPHYEVETPESKPATPVKTETITPSILSITPKAIELAQQQTENVRQLLKDTTVFSAEITEEAILESVAIMQTQEEQWDKLKINQITIPKTEVSLWSSFFKIFTHLSTEKYINRPFEKGDTFELKIAEFHLFHITRIRMKQKDSLTFCVVQSKRKPTDETYIFELLVKLPIRAGGMLEVYRNRTNEPELINSWKIEEVLHKRPKSAENYEKGSKKGGILWILWM